MLWGNWGRIKKHPGCENYEELLLVLARRGKVWLLNSAFLHNASHVSSQREGLRARDSAMVIFLGLKRSRRAEDKPEKQVEGVQHRATVLDKHIFLLPLRKFILKFSWSESLAKHVHPNFLRADSLPGACIQMYQLCFRRPNPDFGCHQTANCSSLFFCLFQNYKPGGEVRWEGVGTDLWDLGDFSTSTALGSGARSYVEMFLRLSSVQVSLYPRLTVRGVIMAGREIYGGGAPAPLCLFLNHPAAGCRSLSNYLSPSSLHSAILVTPSLCSFCQRQWESFILAGKTKRTLEGGEAEKVCASIWDALLLWGCVQNVCMHIYNFLY